MKSSRTSSFKPRELRSTTIVIAALLAVSLSGACTDSGGSARGGSSGTSDSEAGTVGSTDGPATGGTTGGGDPGTGGATATGSDSEDDSSGSEPGDSGGSESGGTGDFPTEPGASMAACNTLSVASIADLNLVLDAFESDWEDTASGYGLAPDDPPVVCLATGQYGNLAISGRDFSGRPPLTIRGEGDFTRDDWSPRAGARIGRVTFVNSNNVRVMGVEAMSANGGHGFFGSTACTLERSVIMDDIARDTGAAATSPSSFDLFLIEDSVGCALTQNAILGGNSRQVGSITSTSDGILIERNVFDQGGGDNINVRGGVHSGWVVTNNLFGGRGRAPGGTHQDAMQVFETDGGAANHSNGTYEGNLLFVRPSWGADSHAAFQMFWWGGGSGPSSNNTYTNNLAINTNGVVKGGSQGNGSMATFNTQGMMTDVVGAEASTYTASWGGFEDAAVSNHNVVPQNSPSDDKGAGPDGLPIIVPNSGNADEGADWSPQEDYFARPLTREDTIGMCSPVEGTRVHWDHADPTGAFELLQWMFDDDAHDHWKDYGWPVAPMTHIVADPDNELAQTAGQYSAFDDDGLYEG